MNSKSGKSNQEFYDEYSTEEEDEDMINENGNIYTESETPHYVSIVDTIPTIDFLMNPNCISSHQTNENEDQVSSNCDEDENENSYVPLTQPKSHNSCPPSVSCKISNDSSNTNSSDDISTTAVNDNQSFCGVYDGYSNHDDYENKESNDEQVFGILDMKPESLPVPPFFNEPATIEAMERLGFVPADLMPSDYSQVPGNDEIRFRLIIELEKRRIQMIEEVIDERNKIIKGAQMQEANITSNHNNSKAKAKIKRKGKRKVKKVGKKKKKKVKQVYPDEYEESTVIKHNKPKSKRRRVKKIKQEPEPEPELEPEITNNFLSITKPTITRKKGVKKELTADEIRKKKIEKTILNQQKKVQLEIAKKTEESEKRLKLQQEQKNREAYEIKQKRLQRKKEIFLMKKENDLKKQRAAQKALMKMDEVEQRQAEIRRKKLDEIKRKNELREQRLMRAKCNMQMKHDEQVRRLNDSMQKAESKNKITQGIITKGRPSRATAKIIVPQVPPKKHQSPK
ncbi:hypothetical protein M9Y10_009009 [Tritrichomonas musculus]|uniref:Uncharacterized protein n=1 Tax=Tritrichomonas musculus TaxID=1915356 RepID=A0ABR2IZP0_9EUKA